jgi:drug/metabolite transporter (DMT)-like permease
MTPEPAIRYASLLRLHAPSFSRNRSRSCPYWNWAGISNRPDFLIGIGAVWFLAVIAAQAGTETFHSVQAKLPRRKRDALVSFLQYGGYSIAAASMASYFALAFWTSYRPSWLVGLMFAGILMLFSSGFVHKGRPRRNTRNQKNA